MTTDRVNEVTATDSDPQIHVVSRNAIPPLRSVTHDGKVHDLGELRDFRWNDQLRAFLPSDSRFSASWVRLTQGETLQTHVHPIYSIMVFYSGSGRMLGDLERPVAKEDVVVVPPGCAHGFVGGPDGLYGLSIQFGEGLYTKPETPRVQFLDGEETLESLIIHNETRMKEFETKPVFELLESGTLNDPRRRQRYMDALQIWVDGNQTLLLSRQATCADSTYSEVFFDHMQDEIGHDLMHKNRTDDEGKATKQARDPIMEAITNWFAYQMYVLDNAEKAAIIHLVIENASAIYHTRAKPVLSRFVNEEYFDVHVDNDDEHAKMGVELLKNESPATYARLREIIDEAWDMIGAMTDRLVDLTNAE